MLEMLPENAVAKGAVVMFVFAPMTGFVALTMAVATALTATPIDPQAARGHWDQVIAHERLNDAPGALREARLALASDPTKTDYYTKVSAIRGTLMVDALYHGDKAEAQRQAEALALLGAQFVQFKAEADAARSLWPYEPLTMTPAFQLRYGQALFLTGQMVGADIYLTRAAQTGLLGAEAHVWLYAMYEHRGDTTGMAALADKPWIRFRESNPVYKALKEWVAVR